MFWIFTPSSFTEYARPPAKIKISSGKQEETYEVSRVLDAKTIGLSNGERIRLIGVDGPGSENVSEDERNAKRLGIDLEHYRSFREKTRAFIERSLGTSELRLEFDREQSKENYRDREGRLLAYLYIETLVPDTVDVSEDDWYLHVPHEGRQSVFLNASLIRSGFSVAARDASFQYKDAFMSLEQAAKDKNRGLWERR